MESHDVTKNTISKKLSQFFIFAIVKYDLFVTGTENWTRLRHNFGDMADENVVAFSAPSPKKVAGQLNLPSQDIFHNADRWIYTTLLAFESNDRLETPNFQGMWGPR